MPSRCYLKNRVLFRGSHTVDKPRRKNDFEDMPPHWRVIDLTDGGAGLAGQILADLGADVVLVEPPDGVPTRKRGPFFDYLEHPDHSFEFWSVHRGKRSITLDPDTQSGQETLRTLAESADIWIDQGASSHEEEPRFDYPHLSEINSSLIHISITPFGEVGPKTHWAATDLTVSASTMTMTLTGDRDRAPLSCSVPQAFRHAGSEAATAALLAATERERSGLGQHIDISAQASMMVATQGTVLSHGWNDAPPTRVSGGIQAGQYRLRFVYPCADGYVNLTFLFGHLGEATTRFVDWMEEEGACSQAMRDEDWVAYGLRLESGDIEVQEHDSRLAEVERFTRSKTKAELFAAAFDRKLLIVPLCDGLDLIRSEQLTQRKYWTSLMHPDLEQKVIYPGPFAQLPASPIQYRRPPPNLGEHSKEILTETRPKKEPKRPGRPPTAPALEGLRVLDLSWVVAGPSITRVLADYGALVIKIESPLAPDHLRHGNPFLNGIADPERSGQFCNLNAGKLSLAINLKIPEAREVILRLVDWADVVVENFSPRGMKSLNLDYPTLRDRKPEIIVLSSCLAGQTGPESQLAGYGTMGAALAGFGALTGWPDRPPSGPFLAYTDYVSPRFALAALLAALEHRRKTGEGQHIDASQTEMALHMLGSAILESSVHGRVVSPRGNASPHYAPSGVYPAQGEDRWIAIAAPDESTWHALAAHANRGWENDPRFISASSRLTHRSELDAALAQWTTAHSVDALETDLQACGVAVHRVSTSRDCFEDPQLKARNHFVNLDHPLMGPVPHESSRMRFSRTPAQIQHAGPTLGQHNAEILSQILSFSDEEIAQLVISGAVG
ncbi:MAG: hypothetical protein CL917_08730 [Deltaproteobacteria bacterium]|nr:hypothetical protein [Deltaproteobacteria bacterium]